MSQLAGLLPGVPGAAMTAPVPPPDSSGGHGAPVNARYLASVSAPLA